MLSTWPAFHHCDCAQARGCSTISPALGMRLVSGRAGGSPGPGASRPDAAVQAHAQRPRPRRDRSRPGSRRCCRGRGRGPSTAARCGRSSASRTGRPALSRARISSTLAPDATTCCAALSASPSPASQNARMAASSREGGAWAAITAPASAMRANSEESRARHRAILRRLTESNTCLIHLFKSLSGGSEIRLYEAASTPP